MCQYDETTIDENKSKASNWVHCNQQMHQCQIFLAARPGCSLVGTSAFKACLLLLFATALATQAPAGRLTAMSGVEVFSLTDLTQPTAALVLDAAAFLRPIAARLSEPLLAKSCTPGLLAACNPLFAAFLLPAAMVVVLLPLPAAPEQASAVLLLLCLTVTAVVVLSAAVADALDLVVTLEHAAPGLAALERWTAAPLACLAGATALTPLAAAEALALVVMLDGCVAALVAVTVRDVTADPEAVGETAGLLGAAMDHAGLVVGRAAEGPVLEVQWVVIGKPMESRLLLSAWS